VVLVGDNPAREVARRQEEDVRRNRDEVDRSPAAGIDEPGRVAGAAREAQRRSGRARHSGSASAAAADRSPCGDRGDRSRQGRRRISPPQCRPHRDRPAGARAVHAASLHRAGEVRPCLARRPPARPSSAGRSPSS
jgi:hypothetical protein